MLPETLLNLWYVPGAVLGLCLFLMIQNDYNIVPASRSLYISGACRFDFFFFKSSFSPSVAQLEKCNNHIDLNIIVEKNFDFLLKHLSTLDFCCGEQYPGIIGLNIHSKNTLRSNKLDYSLPSLRVNFFFLRVLFCLAWSEIVTDPKIKSIEEMELKFLCQSSWGLPWRYISLRPKEWSHHLGKQFFNNWNILTTC